MNKQLKKILFNRVTIVLFIALMIAVICIIPAVIKVNDDRAKLAKIESVGIPLIQSELEAYHYSHAVYPTTLAELLKDSQVTQSGGTATTLKVLPYFTHLRYGAQDNGQTYTISYTSYTGGQKSVTGGDAQNTSR